MMTTLDNGQLIVIEGADDLVKLLRWRDENKDLVRAFRPMIQEGVIEYGEDGMYRQEFSTLSEYTYRHDYLAGGILKGFGFEYDSRTWQASNIKGMITFYPTDLAIQDMITVHASCMSVMEYAPQFVKSVDNKLVIKVT